MESEVDGGGSKMYIYEQRVDMRERGKAEVREGEREEGYKRDKKGEGIRKDRGIPSLQSWGCCERR